MTPASNVHCNSRMPYIMQQCLWVPGSVTGAILLSKRLFILCAHVLTEWRMRSNEPVALVRKSNKMSEHGVITQSRCSSVCGYQWSMTRAILCVNKLCVLFAHVLTSACTDSSPWRSSTAGNLLVLYKS